MEAALASAERQIERLRVRERGQARALMEARHQLHEASSASSAISDDCALSPEAGGRAQPPFLFPGFSHFLLCAERLHEASLELWRWSRVPQKLATAEGLLIAGAAIPAGMQYALGSKSTALLHQGSAISILQQ